MNTNHFRSLLVAGVFVVAAAFLLIGCADIINADKVENPQITDENLRANATGGATPLVTGLRRQMAAVMGIQSLIGDLVSDNLDNRTSFYDNRLSFPTQITPTTFTYDATYTNMQVMNALADFGLSVIIPIDKNATADQIAEVHFYKGMALLLLGENFRMFPVAEKGPLVTSAQAFNLAVTEFRLGRSSSQTTMVNNCYLALARTYRMLGDPTNAKAYADSALTITGGTTYVFYAPQDATNGPTSTLLAALVTRASNDIQPNPRLDFLDPKIINNTIPMPVLKAEEAYLIRAEYWLKQGNLANARTEMSSAVALALTRPRTNFRDTDPRTSRPNDSTMVVYTDSGRTYPAIPGLIKRRSGLTLPIATVSWTSQTTTTIANLASVPVGSGTAPNTQRFEHIRMLYLLRQEIFFGEGRRMSDLGIRLPVTQRQIDGNPNVAGTAATQVLVPAHIPPNNEYTLFTISGTTVTMRWDMNKEIALNINNVSPFAPIP